MEEIEMAIGEWQTISINVGEMTSVTITKIENSAVDPSLNSKGKRSFSQRARERGRGRGREGGMGWSVKLLNSSGFAFHFCCLHLLVLLSIFHLSTAQNATTDPSEGTASLSGLLNFTVQITYEKVMFE
uniref:Uncharacterized protein n=1 Tax=Salix viminalis TaxID=40686 RepID=A0A6N2M7I9_SALVM